MPQWVRSFSPSFAASSSTIRKSLVVPGIDQRPTPALFTGQAHSLPHDGHTRADRHGGIDAKLDIAGA